MSRHKKQPVIKKGSPRTQYQITFAHGVYMTVDTKAEALTKAKEVWEYIDGKFTKANMYVSIIEITTNRIFDTREGDKV